MLILDERHQIHVVLASDDEDALAAVTLGVRVLQDIEQVASLDVEDDFFEPDAALRPELRVLRVVPVEGTSPVNAYGRRRTIVHAPSSLQSSTHSPTTSRAHCTCRRHRAARRERVRRARSILAPTISTCAAAITRAAGMRPNWPAGSRCLSRPRRSIPHSDRRKRCSRCSTVGWASITALLRQIRRAQADLPYLPDSPYLPSHDTHL